MKKIIIPILLIIAFMLAMPAASMAGNGHGHYKHYNHGYRYNNGPYFNANFFYGPAYYPRPFVYYAPPPPPVIYAPPPVYYGPSYYPPVTGFNFGLVID